MLQTSLLQASLFKLAGHPEGIQGEPFMDKFILDEPKEIEGVS